MEESILVPHGISDVENKLIAFFHEEKVGIEPNNILDIFGRIKGIFSETSEVLDNLRRVHKGKACLRKNSEKFRDALILDATPDRCQARSLKRCVTKSYNEYTRQYDIYDNEEGYEFVYGSNANLTACTDIDEWVRHLVGNKGQHRLEGELLLESLFFSEDDFIKALEKFETNQMEKKSDAVTSNQVDFNIIKSNSTPSKESSTLDQMSQSSNQQDPL